MQGDLDVASRVSAIICNIFISDEGLRRELLRSDVAFSGCVGFISGDFQNMTYGLALA